jgi:molybdopterin biosynthesis enzyme
LLDPPARSPHFAAVTKTQNPRLSRLTALDDALERLSGLLRPAAPRDVPVGESCGRIAAASIAVPADVPPAPRAHTDGWAVNSADLVGASSYSPALLTPPPVWIDAGDAMPSGTDAVLPFHDLSESVPGTAEAGASVAPGEGVRLAGQDIASGHVVVPAGVRVMPVQLGVLGALGLETISVRTPRVRIVEAGAARGHAQAVRAWLAAWGADVIGSGESGDRPSLADIFRQPRADLVISIGGTGEGRNDFAAASLADAGEIAVRGVALRPGASLTFGQAGGVPVLLLPGRLDALFAGLLSVGDFALRRLGGCAGDSEAIPALLALKASSAIGFSEIFVVTRDGDAVRPHPLSEAGWDVLASASGWFTVPPGSEGFAAGDRVQVRPFQPR